MAAGIELLKVVVQLLSPLLSAFIVVRGWHIASQDQSRRELRKEIRAEIDRIRRLVDQASIDATKIWSTEYLGGASAEQAQLLIAIGRISNSVVRLKPFQINATRQVMRFRRLVTLNIEGSRPALPSDSQFLQQIPARASDIEDALEKEFREEFQLEDSGFKDYVCRLVFFPRERKRRPSDEGQTYS